MPDLIINRVDNDSHVINTYALENDNQQLEIQDQLE